MSSTATATEPLLLRQQQCHRPTANRASRLTVMAATVLVLLLLLTPASGHLHLGLFSPPPAEPPVNLTIVAGATEKGAGM
jgi:hypothetical protein